MRSSVVPLLQVYQALAGVRVGGYQHQWVETLRGVYEGIGRLCEHLTLLFSNTPCLCPVRRPHVSEFVFNSKSAIWSALRP